MHLLYLNSICRYLSYYFPIFVKIKKNTAVKHLHQNFSFLLKTSFYSRRKIKGKGSMSYDKKYRLLHHIIDATVFVFLNPYITFNLFLTILYVTLSNKMIKIPLIFDSNRCSRQIFSCEYFNPFRVI